jgi:tetratricopeptide (TPR) repeat protein
MSKRKSNYNSKTMDNSRCSRASLFRPSCHRLSPLSLLGISLLFLSPAQAQDKSTPPDRPQTGSVGTVVPNTPATTGTTATPLTRSSDAWKRGDIPTAVKEIETALKDNDKQPDLLNWYGFLLLRQNRPADAIAPLEKALSLGADSVELEVNLASALLLKPGATLDDLHRSVSLLEKATASKPDMMEAQTNLGQAFLRVGRPGDAVLTYRKIIEKLPNNAPLQRMYGYALLKAGLSAEAEVALRRAVDINPQDGEAWGLIGSLELQQGNRDEAITSLENARKFGPPNVTILSNLGLVYSQSGKYSLAATAYGAAADLAEAMTPPNVTPRINQGIAFSRSEKWDAAATAYAKALEKDPNSYDALINLGSIKYQQGDTKQAIRLYTTAAEQTPTLPLAWANLGSALDSLHHYRESATAWQKALSADPKNRQYAAALRVAAARAGQNDMLAEAHRVAATKNPTATPSNERGSTLPRKTRPQTKASEKQRNLAKALAVFKEAVHREPKSASAWNELGTAYEQHGQIQPAINAYKRAVYLNPKFAPARANLNRFTSHARRFRRAKGRAMRIDEKRPVKQSPKPNTPEKTKTNPPTAAPSPPAPGTVPTPKPSPAAAPPSGNGAVKP